MFSKKYYVIVGVDSDGMEHFISGTDACCKLSAWFKTLLFKNRFRHSDMFVRIYPKCFDED